MPPPDLPVNPYAPPAADVEARPARGRYSQSSYAGERRSVLLMILLSVVTLGVYPIIWYLRRAPFLDALSADKKVGPMPWIAVGLLGAFFVVAAARLPEGVVRFTQLASGILNLVLAFRVAHILRSDFARSGRIIGVSGAGVFFFGCLYLQHVMNEAAEVPARAREDEGAA
jgi:hypothetical protein